MTPERWQQIDHLLQAALERPAEARTAFLQQACAGDTALLHEVESLLCFEPDDDDFLRRPPAAVAAEMIQQAGTAELVIGRRLGRYELLRMLGRGGMGTVFLAYDTELERQVALKLLPRRFTREPERVRRFRQEARAISALNHPNILTLHEIGQTKLGESDIHFLATEFVEGQTLRARLRTQKLPELATPLTLGAALDIAIQTASALHVAHRAGVIHRDIKPENLMVRPDGLVKVLDFGLAKLLRVRNAEWGVRSEEYLKKLSPTETNTPHSALRTPHLTAPGAVMGTINYMSPEQARGLDVDERSDLFSLGVVLYEMLTGRAPFTGATSGDVMVSILEREPPPLKLTAPRLPTALQAILNRMLAKECAARYQQADDVARDLKDLKDELAMAARHKSSAQHAPLDLPVGLSSVSLSLGEIGQALTVAPTIAPTVAPNVTGAAFTARTTQRDQGRVTAKWKAAIHSFAQVPRPALALAAVALAGLIGWAGFRYGRPDHNATIRSIAVLPFVNANADPAMDYLPDGITESLMQSLAQLPDLRVMARGAVFAYKGREIDPRQAGKDLGVHAVITGRVQRQGDRLLISVELADAHDGTLLWNEQFPRPFADVQMVQLEIARELTNKLRLRLSAPQQRQLEERYTQNSEAYQLFLLGRYHWNKRNSAGMLKSVEYFQQASEKDPGFALAYVGLADAYNTLNAYRVRPPSEMVPLARAAAERALQIDDQLADAHASLGKLLTDATFEWVAAEQQFKRALELNPNLANAHHWYATLLGALGRFDEAVAEARKADDLDAHAVATQTQLGAILYRARRYDEALGVLHQTLERNPNHATANIYAGFCYLMQQRYEESVAEMRRAQTIAPQSPDVISSLGLAYGLAGKRAEALRCQAELKALARDHYVSPSHHAAIAAGLGDWDTYFVLMNKCVDEGLPIIRGLKTDPMFDIARPDPRFNDLLRRTGFTQ